MRIRGPTGPTYKNIKFENQELPQTMAITLNSIPFLIFGDKSCCQKRDCHFVITRSHRAF